MFCISAVSGKAKLATIFVDVAISRLSAAKSVASLASDVKFFATDVAVKRGVGGARFLGELRFHANMLGTAPGLGLTLPFRLLRKSSVLKCLEQTRVPSFTEKYGPTSLLIARIHCFIRSLSSGKRKKEIFSPVSLSRLSFFVQSSTQQFVGISQPLHDGFRTYNAKISCSET